MYRSESWINVPAAKEENGITQIGTLDVSLRADPADEAGRVIGARGNIPANTLLTIPGLKFNRDKVYAKAKQDFEGGMDPRIHIVTESEVEKYRGIMREQLSRVSRTKLQSWIDESNIKGNEDYALLMGETISFSDESISLENGRKIGDFADDIELK